MLIFLIFFPWLGYLYYKLKTTYNKDLALFITKERRYLLTEMPKGDYQKFEYDKGYYVKDETCAFLRKSGKTLYIYSMGNPLPLKTLDHKKAEWLSSDALMPVINNEHIKKVVTTTKDVKDSLLILGAIASVVCVIITGLIASKIFG